MSSASPSAAQQIGGRTRRYDVNLTPVWRAENSFGYVEGWIGVYVQSHAINNRTQAASNGLAIQHL